MSISTGAPRAFARALGFQEENGTAANATPAMPVSVVAAVSNWRRPLSISRSSVDFRSLAGLPHYTRRYAINRRLPRCCRAFRAGYAGSLPGSRWGSRRRSLCAAPARARSDAGPPPLTVAEAKEPATAAGTPAAPAAASQFVSYADVVDATAPAVVNIYTERRVVVPNVEGCRRSSRSSSATCGRTIARARRTEPRLRNHLGRPGTRGHQLSRDRAATQIKVQLKNGKSGTATLVGADPDTRSSRSSRSALARCRSRRSGARTNCGWASPCSQSATRSGSARR